LDIGPIVGGLAPSGEAFGATELQVELGKRLVIQRKPCSVFRV
jgi:hypothetical protein